MILCILSRHLDQLLLASIDPEPCFLAQMFLLEHESRSTCLIFNTPLWSSESCIFTQNWCHTFFKIDFNDNLVQCISKHEFSRAVNELNFSRLGSLKWYRTWICFLNLNHHILCNFFAALIVLVKWSCFSLLAASNQDLGSARLFLNSIRKHNIFNFSSR